LYTQQRQQAANMFLGEHEQKMPLANQSPKHGQGVLLKLCTC
jgi:homospermidine synthase